MIRRFNTTVVGIIIMGASIIRTHGRHRVYATSNWLLFVPLSCVSPSETSLKGTARTKIRTSVLFVVVCHVEESANSVDQICTHFHRIFRQLMCSLECILCQILDLDYPRQRHHRGLRICFVVYAFCRRQIVKLHGWVHLFRRKSPESAPTQKGPRSVQHRRKLHVEGHLQTSKTPLHSYDDGGPHHDGLRLMFSRWRLCDLALCWRQVVLNATRVAVETHGIGNEAKHPGFSI
mmetsp:Transcript_49418/g.131169  ORF Transcript_49418/g.131169 Transcript_49418/m.131169 type:complete len:234 (+) Transcript_49418:1440-2141(+)